MRKQVIIINGNPKSGKTTVANIIADHHKAIVRSSIDFVKEISMEYFDWDGQKDTRSRKFLSDMKYFLNSYTDLVEYDLECAHDEFLESDAEYMIIDIREKDEIEKYREKFDAVTVLIERFDAPFVSSNLSDEQVKETIYDYTIANDGTIGCLENAVYQFLRELETDIFSADLYLRENDKDRFICVVSSLNEAFEILRKWAAERDFESLYVRQWLNVEGEIILDFGSHFSFFVIKNQTGLFL